MRLTIAAPAPADGRSVSVAIEGDRLVEPVGTPDVSLPEGWSVTPGLIDLQVNGIGDVFPLEQPERLGDLDLRLAAAGVTGYLVAAPSSDPAQVGALARASADFAAGPGNGLLGLHLEGPVLAPTFRGAHPAEHLRTGSDSRARELLDLPGVRIVTVAPEVEGAMDYAREALARGIRVSAGHTGATAEQAREAIGAGVRLATHLFNAMTPVHQRAPGAALAYLLDPRALVTFIADGEHLHDDLVELILSVAVERAILVSDLAPDMALPAPDAAVRATGAVRLPDGVLAGARATLADAVRRVARRHGRGLAQAVRLASEHPAAVLGEASRGRLEHGARADLVVWDADDRVAACIRAGEVVFRAEGLGRLL
ncbi:MAG: amidohydrolase family protein [Acidobacteria bacterium]|nr:amidohydrolase family protein [Acidobacteriota bacterium]